MRDISKKLTIINTGERKEKTSGTSTTQTASYGGGGGGVAIGGGLYLPKATWDKVFEIKSTSSGEEYLFGKLPIALQYGLTMYVDGEMIELPSLAQGLPFDGRTIWYNPNTNQIEVIGGTGGEGGEGVSYFWDLDGIPDWITNSKPKYTYTEIEGTPDLTKYALASQIPSLSGYATESWVTKQNYAEKATTLSGYGITDSYTKTNVDDLLKSYVTLGGTQTITGEKNFTGGLKVNGSPIYYDTEKKYWKLEGDLLVTGGVNMYGSDSSFTPSTIMDAILYDDATLGINSNGQLYVKGGAGGGINTTDLQNYLTQNSYLNVTSGDNRYLQLSGGTITNTLQIGSNDNTSFLGLRIVRSGSALMLNHTSSNAYIGLGAFSNGTYSNKYMLLFGETGLKYSEDGQTTFKDILHSGNIGSYNAAGAYKLLTSTNASMVYESSGALYVGDNTYTTKTTYLLGKDIRLRYGASATEGLRLAESGNVGIGTTSPSSKLSVYGGVTLDGYFASDSVTKVKDLGSKALVISTNYDRTNWGMNLWIEGNGNGYIQQQAFADSGTTYPLVLQPFGGNVGIGIKYPSAKLHVSGDILATGGITTNDSVTINGIKLSKSKDGVLYLDGNLVVKGGVTMYGTDATSSPSILDSLPIASTSAKGIAQFNPSDFSVVNGVVSFVGSVDGGVASSVAWGNITGKPTFASVATSGKYSDLSGTPSSLPASDVYSWAKAANKPSYTWSEITSKPTWIGSSKPSYSYSEITGAISTTELQNYLTQNSYLNVTSGDNRYLQLSGGTITNTLQIGSNDNTSFLGLRIVRSGSALMLNHTSSNAYIGLGAFSNGTYSNKYMLLFGETGLKYSEDGQTTFKDILHSGNIGSYNAAGAYKLLTSTNASMVYESSGALYVGDNTYTTKTTYLLGKDIRLRYGASATEGLRLAESGNVGIGTTSPSYKLDVNGVIRANGNILLQDANSTTGGGIAFWNRDSGWVNGTINAEKLILNYVGGNVGIGTLNPSAKLHVQGDILATGGITMYSDQRKKTILRHVELSLKQIANAPLIEHYYNTDEKKTTHVGSIAQYWYGMNDWFCKQDSEGFLTMEIQNAALASAISVARELDRYETKTDKAIRKLKKRINELEDELERLKSA